MIGIEEKLRAAIRKLENVNVNNQKTEWKIKDAKGLVKQSLDAYQEQENKSSNDDSLNGNVFDEDFFNFSPQDISYDVRHLKGLSKDEKLRLLAFELSADAHHRSLTPTKKFQQNDNLKSMISKAKKIEEYLRGEEDE